jgi:hypothetical protein
VAAQHLRGDDEPADREEDVDAEEPVRRERRRAGREVEQADADDGDDPQQFDVEAPRGGGGGVGQRQNPRVS